MAHRNAAEVLADNGLTRLRAADGSKSTTQGTLLMGPYLAAAGRSRGGGRSVAARVVGYLESARNPVGGAAALAGLALAFAGFAGAYWPVVVGGLYGAGALLAPPPRPPPRSRIPRPGWTNCGPTW